ncbi:Aste57867_5102 [Aphanomyces stellatus]|uniref:Aste57867_5102 protein n=1 Tax=Aphanomyces stellatus TaxID=120398 RepID=A0A485KGQ1_9STRA|nr:hypothetical protein As57867_005089 [Aphanomyces stellatus]VFT82182.1 Aste57867_5102 [Aphanomyces stellatus]
MSKRATSRNFILTRPAPSSAIVATSQQDRFHLATIDHENYNIKLIDVCLSIGNRELLVGAQLKLEAGVHYGLVGRNGTGKSTLLQALGDGLFEGISSHIHVMYVHQLFHVDLDDGGGSTSVVDVLLSGDKSRAARQHQITALEAALEHQTIHRTLEELEFEATDAAREKMARVAIKRSGLRGLTARNQLLALEHKVKAMADKLEKEQDVVFTDTDDEILHANDWLETLYAQEDMSSESRAREILADIGKVLGTNTD